ncbi:MAG TPA: discoidin domain-containing protein, partial [Streptosporangiaceae bacterium]|nr:discoidin domain-containing protein [Streptosporangiaceae bacterium]
MRSPRSPRLLKRLLRTPVLLAAAVLLLGLIVPSAMSGTTAIKNTATTAASCGTTNLALNKTATSSSTESAAYPASNAVDGNTGTRWSSAFSDPQWLEVDLGSSQSICQVTLNWEAAYATAFQIQTSTDGTNWTSIYSTTTGTGGTQTLSVTGTGRYIRMYGTTRATGYGYSLWEFGVYGPASGGGTTCGTTNVALNQTATASSTESGAYPASDAVDGNTGTRWSSAFSDPQWLEADLGSSQSICGVTLNWEAAYATAFQIQTSTDGTNWTSIYSTTSGTGGTQNLTVSGTGRYIRMYGTARATAYGYSLWEFQVFSSGSGGGTTPPPTGCTGQSNTPNFGPNVYVFDPSMSSSSIQSTLDSVFNTQKLNQFGTQRYALLFKPGTYSAEANIGYYTSIQGLGQNPDDVTINGDVTVDSFDGTGNATQNFWRSAENMAINPSSGSDRWAVAQAGPFRRMDVHGGLELYPASYGYASGGYIADSKVSGQVSSVSQQQWYSQDSNFGSWSGSVWNMVFSGVTGAPAQSFPSPPMTTLATTPTSRDVPYLYVDSSGNYHVFVPSLRTNASGASWANGSTPGTSLPMSQFFVATPSDTAAQINSALAQGCNLFFTPGVYNINQTLNVTNPDTVVLGVGFPTLIPQNGVNTMQVGDVNGVRIDGLLFDAGTTNSNALLTVGTSGSTTSHASDPTSVQDTFFRIGGDIAGQAT